jgi:hypothetical protein
MDQMKDMTSFRQMQHLPVEMFIYIALFPMLCAGQTHSPHLEVLATSLKSRQRHGHLCAKSRVLSATPVHATS